MENPHQVIEAAEVALLRASLNARHAAALIATARGSVVRESLPADHSGAVIVPFPSFPVPGPMSGSECRVLQRLIPRLTEAELARFILRCGGRS
jgi:hypothetical protein